MRSQMRWGKVRLSLAGLSCVLAASIARADGDAAAGKSVFNKCAACHSPEAGVNKIGPSLHGIVGRPAHSIENYSYSDAMKNHNVTWDEAELDKYLENPRGVVQGTKMIFAGLPKKTDRDNLISYLTTLK